MMKKAVVLVLAGMGVWVSADETINDMPASLKASVEWVWKNRISPKSASAPLGEGSTVRKNLIFDQIWFEEGKLFYCGRWQSSQKLTLDNRKKLEQVVSQKINNWAGLLTGYDGWPYREIPVKIVGWAVLDASVIVERQSDEIVYTTAEHDPVSDQDSQVPANVPITPSACWRFDHFSDSRYTYESCPGGAQNHFDMYLWATTSWKGAVGGDWGQRMSESAWLSGSSMIDHEMGHGFGIVDFYEANQRPDDMNGGKIKSIMWAGNSNTITEWDKWMLRYIWTQLKTDTKRFPPRTTALAEADGRKAHSSNASSINGKRYAIISRDGILFIAPTAGEQGAAIHVEVVDIAGKEVASAALSAKAAAPLAVQAGSLRSGCCLVRIRGNGTDAIHRVRITGR